MRLLDEMPEMGIVETWLNCRTLTTKDLFGKPALIHFWSVSCPSCKNQLQKINTIRQQYHDVLNVVGIHMPRSREDKDVGKVNDIIRKYHIKYPVAVDNDEKITNAFGSRSVPCYYIFDEKGVLRYHQNGASTMSLFERRIHRIVQQTL